MKCSKRVVILFVICLTGGITASVYAFTQSPRFFLFQLGRAIDSDNTIKVQSLVDIDRAVDDYVTSAIKLVKADVLTQTQASGNGFEALGGMIAVGAMDSMADGLKVQISTQARNGLDAMLQQQDQPVTQYLMSQSVQKTGRDTATVVISKPSSLDENSSLESVELELEKINGSWKAVGLSDRTIQEIYQVQQSISTKTSTATDELETPVNSMPQEEIQVQSDYHSTSEGFQMSEEEVNDEQSTIEITDSVVGQAGTLVADNPAARINLRDEPSASVPTRRYGIVGDRVTIQKSVSGSDGYTWHKVQFQESGAVGWIRSDFIALNP